MTPTREEALEQLERVLASEVFAGSSRLSRFLRFITERSLDGQSERLKEYVIGVEVFDRGEHYDPRLDSIVRVEAGRLRAKLEQYYQGPGREDAVVIRLQKGGYAPGFEWKSQATVAPASGAANSAREMSSPLPPPTVASSPATAPPPHSPGFGDRRHAGRTRRFVVRGGAIAVGLAAIVAVAIAIFRPEPAPANSVAVLPFSTYDTAPSDSTITTRLTEGITAELVRARQFEVVPSRNARGETEGSAQSIARRLHASWLLDGRVTTEGPSLRVEARLMNPARNRKLWVETFRGDPADLDELSRRIGASASAALKDNAAGGE